MAVYALLTSILKVALPDHHKRTGCRHGDGAVPLVVGRIGVDLELASSRCPVGVVSLAEDTVPMTILLTAFPGDDEPAIGTHGGGRDILVECRIGVDLELVSSHAAIGVEALAEDAVAAPILLSTRPHHHESAV